jgi:hypothetical protein
MLGAGALGGKAEAMQIFPPAIFMNLGALEALADPLGDLRAIPPNP